MNSLQQYHTVWILVRAIEYNISLTSIVMYVTVVERLNCWIFSVHSAFHLFIKY